MSPRKILLDGVVACLEQIRTADGYNTDSGGEVTTELYQVPDDAVAALSATIVRQARSSDAGKARTHRLTEIGVAIKVPAGADDAQAQMDRAVADVEQAMEPTRANLARFPAGYEYPQYSEMRPLNPEQGLSAGWIGALVVYQSHIPIR